MPDPGLETENRRAVVRQSRLESPLMDALAVAVATIEAKASFLPGRVNGPADAYRHIVWVGEMTRRFGPGVAGGIADLHEWQGQASAYIREATGEARDPINDSAATAMDRRNNLLGVSIGESARSFDDVLQNGARGDRPQPRGWFRRHDRRGLAAARALARQPVGRRDAMELAAARLDPRAPRACRDIHASRRGLSARCQPPGACRNAPFGPRRRTPRRVDADAAGRRGRRRPRFRPCPSAGWAPRAGTYAVETMSGGASAARHSSPTYVPLCCRGTKRPVPGFASTCFPSQIHAPRR